MLYRTHKTYCGLSSILLALVSSALLPQPGQAETAKQLAQTEGSDPPVVVTVQALTAGDRVCYVDVIDAGGTYSTQYASFEICEQDLVGKDVQLTYETDEILAASCEGNPDCGETETVMLITQAEVITPPNVGTVQETVAGDTLCDIGFVDDSGEIWYRQASLDLCQQNLVDQTVQFTYEVTEIPAYSCMGDPTCEDTDLVTLISDVTLLSDANPDLPTEMPEGGVQDLPDGNYRYWNGTSSSAIVSDEELLSNGGVTFTFRKQENDITGIFAYVDGEAICVQGQVNGDTVSGTSVQTLRGATVLSTGDTYESFGPSGYLMVRQGQRVSSDEVRYRSTLLDLSEMNRINAGTRVPPEDC